MTIAILSRNSTLVLLPAELTLCGRGPRHQVEIIDHLKCVLCIEKKNPVVLYQGRRLDYFDAVIPFVLVLR
jgi:ribosomal protein S6--L-glutamate ligase